MLRGLVWDATSKGTGFGVYEANLNAKSPFYLILLDSQATLKALVSNRIKSKLVLNYLGILNDLIVLGHKGNQSDEKAEFTNEGSELLFTGPPTL